MTKTVELHRSTDNYIIEVHIQRTDVCRHQITKSSRFLAFNPFEFDTKKKEEKNRYKSTTQVPGKMVLQHIILRVACITCMRLI